MNFTTVLSNIVKTIDPRKHRSDVNFVLKHRKSLFVKNLFESLESNGQIKGKNKTLDNS